jgi:hypothetical protein
MAVVVNITWPGITPERYEEFWVKADLDANPPDGGVHHVAWYEDGVLMIQDVWQTAEAFQAFGEARLGPVTAAMGITTQPEVAIYPAQKVFAPGYARA